MIGGVGATGVSAEVLEKEDNWVERNQEVVEMLNRYLAPRDVGSTSADVAVAVVVAAAAAVAVVAADYQSSFAEDKDNAQCGSRN